MSIQHPWQSGPTELLRYALDHLHRPSDFSQRIAFLLLDVGVETLFKTFLELPEEVTRAKLSYSKRREAVEGSFHQLLRGAKDAAGDRLDGIDLAHVQFYHNLRNKLYHQGNGITVPVDKAKGYASIAVELLHRLLSVDLEQEFDHSHRVVFDEIGGFFFCGICKQPVDLRGVGGPGFVLAETLEPVCWKCGSQYAHSCLLYDLVEDFWANWFKSEPDAPCYVDEED
jgi:hypothetical protein